MEQIEISTIVTGMRFSKPVFFDDGKYMFIEAGIHVKPYHVAALSKWHIPFLLSDGHIMEENEILEEESENLDSLSPEPELESELEPELELETLEDGNLEMVEVLDDSELLEEL